MIKIGLAIGIIIACILATASCTTARKCVDTAEKKCPKWGDKHQEW